MKVPQPEFSGLSRFEYYIFRLLCSSHTQPDLLGPIEAAKKYFNQIQSAN
jgi:hypothetical protein